MASDKRGPSSEHRTPPAIFDPAAAIGARAGIYGVWSDGWCAARCGFILPGGDQELISIEGMVPSVAPGFRSRLVVFVDQQEIGTLDLQPGEISAAWEIQSTNSMRMIALEFDRVQALALPDRREAAMLIREISVGHRADFGQREVVQSSRARRSNGLASAAARLWRELLRGDPATDPLGSGNANAGPKTGTAARLAPTAVATTSEPSIRTEAPNDALELFAWRASLIRETIRWAGERRPTRKLCNICGYCGYFHAHWFPVRPEARCPWCLSQERHRLLKLWFDNHQGVFSGARVLHFAAEKSVTAFIKPQAAEYVTADIAPGRCNLTIDIEAIDLRDARFDVVICSHVLEHVDDRRALAEIYRVLTPSGLALLMFPLVEGWTTTYEDPAKTTEDERWQHFGQGDHVRLYGTDVRQRIAAAGFSVEEFTATEPNVTQYGLFPGERLFVAKKSLPTAEDATHGATAFAASGDTEKFR